MIKKRNVSTTNIRKRDFSSIENSLAETPQAEVTKEEEEEENIKEVKELISLRQEIKGVIKSKGMLIQTQKSELPSQQNEDTNSVTKSGIFAMKQDKKKSFAEQKMDEHIEQEMVKRGLLIKQSSIVSEVKKEEELLFQAPEHFSNTSKIKEEEVPQEKTRRELTTISEVTLPVEYKLKNIEETEKALQEISKLNQQPTSKTNNFHFQQPKQQNNKSQQASDDRVFEQFKKRYRKE